MIEINTEPLNLKKGDILFIFVPDGIAAPIAEQIRQSMQSILHTREQDNIAIVLPASFEIGVASRQELQAILDAKS